MMGLEAMLAAMFLAVTLAPAIALLCGSVTLRSPRAHVALRVSGNKRRASALR